LLYLLDANVLIDANRDYYPLSRVPEFWEWLRHHGSIDNVKIPIEVLEELQDGKDDLAIWSKNKETVDALTLNEDADPIVVASIVSEGYAPDLTDDEIDKIGRDPFLIAYAFSDLGNRAVVSTEVSKPSTQRANKKVPDVCRGFGVPCLNTFQFLRGLDFRTSWSK
jgi:hypothetical protein